MTPLATASCLRHRYPDRTEVCFVGTDVVVNPGEKVALLGANGSGKTTVLGHLTGVLRPLEGRVSVLGEDPSRDFWRIRGRVGVMFQNVSDQIIGPTVRDDVALTPRTMRLSRSQIAEKVDRAMQRLGITNLAGRPPHYLSGGERKKVALAGALAMEPDILILDEPLEGLDTTVRGDIVRVIADYCSGERGVIFSTHDLSAAGLLADRVYLIGNRRIITEGPTRQVMADVSLLAQSGLEPSPLARLADVLNRGGLAVAFEPDAVRFGANVLASYAREVARWRLKDPPLRDRSREDRQ